MTFYFSKYQSVTEQNNILIFEGLTRLALQVKLTTLINLCIFELGRYLPRGNQEGDIKIQVSEHTLFTDRYLHSS
jgi:hypothetical protein